jgi:dUTP pyrophosphatase
MHKRITAPTVLIHPDAEAPKRGSDGAAGHDIRCVAGLLGIHSKLKWKPDQLAAWAAMGARGYVELKPGESFLFRTGFAQAIPEGYVCSLQDRSGLGAIKRVHRYAGIIDEDYRGEWMVRLTNHHDEAIVRIDVGDKIVQGIYQEYVIADCPVVDLLEDTSRGTGGFGSTDEPAAPTPAFNIETAEELVPEPEPDPVAPLSLLVGACGEDEPEPDSEPGPEPDAKDVAAAGRAKTEREAAGVSELPEQELLDDLTSRAEAATGREIPTLTIPETPEEYKHLVQPGEILYTGQNATRALSCMRDSQRTAAAEWISRDRTFFPDGAPPIDIDTLRVIMSKEAVAFKPME